MDLLERERGKQGLPIGATSVVRLSLLFNRRNLPVIIPEGAGQYACKFCGIMAITAENSPLYI